MKIFGKIALFFKEVRLEVKKVNWLSRPELFNFTFLVIGFMVAMGVFFGILDFGFSFLLKKFVLPIG